MEVTKWISYQESDKYKENGIGGLGGWFSEGHRWADFLDHFKDEAHPYLEAMRKSIIANSTKGGGDWHQNSNIGVPLFSDNTIATFTYRSWGDFLAAVWSTEENRDSHYMEFYMN